VQQLVGVEVGPPSVELEGFEGDIQADLAAVFEGICQTLFRAVDANGDLVDHIGLNALTPCRAREPEDAQRWVVQAGDLVLTTHGDVYAVGNLGSQFVKGQGGYQADNRLGDLEGDGDEVGVGEGRQVGQAIEPATELDQQAGITHSVEGARVDAQRQCLRRAQNAVVLAEQITCTCCDVQVILSGGLAVSSCFGQAGSRVGSFLQKGDGQVYACYVSN